MSVIDRAAVDAAVQNYHDPYLKQDLISAGCVKSLSIDGATVFLNVEFKLSSGWPERWYSAAVKFQN